MTPPSRYCTDVHCAVLFALRSITFRALMRIILLFCLLPLAVRAEVKDRVAAVVNGQPITISEVEERLGPELTHVPPGPAGPAQRKELVKRGMTRFLPEELFHGRDSPAGLHAS